MRGWILRTSLENEDRGINPYLICRLEVQYELLLRSTKEDFRSSMELQTRIIVIWPIMLELYLSALGSFGIVTENIRLLFVVYNDARPLIPS